MPRITFLFLFLIYTDIIGVDNKEEDFKYFFQLCPSKEKENPYLFHAFIPKNKLLTINTTKEEISKEPESTQTNEYLYKNLSKVFLFNETILVKTCFGPDIIVEIKYEKNETYIYKNNNLENVQYCYSTAVKNTKNNEISIITYWVEKSGENYIHKSKIFYLNEKRFNEKVYSLNTNIEFINKNIENIGKIRDNIYPKSCTTFRGEDIYCSVQFDSKGSQTYGNSYVIETKKILENSSEEKIILVSGSTSFDSNIYHKPVAIGLSLYEIFDIFLTEYHDKKNNKTRLISSSFKKNLKHFYYSKISLSEMSYLGINIEDRYIEPSLFNNLVPNVNDLIIIYIMKIGKETNNKMGLIMSRFNLVNSMMRYSDFQKYSLSNYIRYDICLEPKYMQSIFINSQINYTESDRNIIEYNKDKKKYYEYQRDIVSFIACSNGDSVKYETKKIAMPQCLNILDEINGLNNSILKFENNSIILDIYNDPVLFSLRNKNIEFINSNTLYKNIIKIKVKTKNNKNFEDLNSNNNFTDPTHIKLELSKKGIILTQKKKYLSISYRLNQTEENENQISCRLFSDICQVKLDLGLDVDKKCDIKYCLYCETENICGECDTSQIDYLILKNNQCICDESKNFKRNPNETIYMCICKENHSFYKDKSLCLPNSKLENGPYVINTTDEISSIPIYDDCHEKCKKCYRSYFTNSESMFCTECYENYILDNRNNCVLCNDLEKDIWFEMGIYKFYYAKILDCIYIFDLNDSLFFYSNKTSCEFDTNRINYISNCINIDKDNFKNYKDSLNNPIEYNPFDTEIKISTKVDNITFHLVNSQSNITNYSDISLDKECIETLKKEYNISEDLDLLIFKADIRKGISTQVEYQFYDPTPNRINIKLNLNKCKNNKIRNLEEEDYKVNLTVPVYWNDTQKKIVEDLYKGHKIFLFNSNIDYFNDICNQYKTESNSDIYLQERKKYYYIDEAFCEEGCILIDDGNYDRIDKLVCQCHIKNTVENYNSTNLIKQEKCEKFNKTVILPNL